jgi:hypothetical protein
MRWIALLFVVAACQSVPKKPFRPPPPMTVEDVATWFMKAALAGDDATARTLTLRYDQVAQMTAKPDGEEKWETTVKDTLDRLAEEGGGEDDWKVEAESVERSTLDPEKDKKVIASVQVAIVTLAVNGHEGVPLLFVYTDEGWRFSPKH